MCEIRGRAEYSKPTLTKGPLPDEAGRDLRGECSAIHDRRKLAPDGWVNCASAQIICCIATPNDECSPAALRATHARRGRGIIRYRSMIDLLTPGSARTIFEF